MGPHGIVPTQFSVSKFSKILALRKLLASGGAWKNLFGDVPEDDWCGFILGSAGAGNVVGISDSCQSAGKSLDVNTSASIKPLASGGAWNDVSVDVAMED